jgi:hypothetical protein
MKHVKEFFDTHPGCDEVHEALGYLFTDKDKADEMLGGVTGEIVFTHHRSEFEGSPAQEKVALPVEPDAGAAVDEKNQDGAPPPAIIHNDATTYGKSAEEVEALQKEQKKNQKPKKESAKKAEAKGKPSGK